MLWIRAIIKWIFSKNTLDAIVFGMKVSSFLYNAIAQAERANSAASKVFAAQAVVDKISEVASPESRQQLTNVINQDQTVFNGFNATYDGNRVNLGYKNNGVSVGVGSDGKVSASVNIPL